MDGGQPDGLLHRPQGHYAIAEIFKPTASTAAGAGTASSPTSSASPSWSRSSPSAPSTSAPSPSAIERSRHLPVHRPARRRRAVLADDPARWTSTAEQRLAEEETARAGGGGPRAPAAVRSRRLGGPGDAVAACQIAPVVGDVLENRARVRAAVEEAGEQAADLVVLPELASERLRLHATRAGGTGRWPSPFDGPTVREWADPVTATADGSLVASASVERGPDGHLFNSCVAGSTHGDVQGRPTARPTCGTWRAGTSPAGREGPPVVDTLGGAGSR